MELQQLFKRSTHRYFHDLRTSAGEAALRSNHSGGRPTNMNESEATTTRLWTSGQCAEYLGISKRTLANWRCNRKAPPALKVNGRPRYRRREVEAWVDQQNARP